MLGESPGKLSPVFSSTKGLDLSHKLFICQAKDRYGKPCGNNTTETQCTYHRQLAVVRARREVADAAKRYATEVRYMVTTQAQDKLLEAVDQLLEVEAAIGQRGRYATAKADQ